MTSIMLYEKEATINQISNGGTSAITITKTMQDIIGVDITKDKTMIAALESTKYGRFICIYCPEIQKKQLRAKAAEEILQAKL